MHAVIERQLAHGERNKVSASYNFAEYLPERRVMMQEWANYLDELKSRRARMLSMLIENSSTTKAKMMGCLSGRF